MNTSLIEAFLTIPNALVMAAASSLIGAASKFIPAANRGLAQRIKPLATIVICTGGCLIPGVQPADMSMGSKVLLGIALGAVAGQAFKLWKQGVLGEDKRLL